MRLTATGVVTPGLPATLHADANLHTGLPGI